MKVSYGEVVIDLQEEDNINVIIGDSGTGKTKMINDLKSILNIYYSGGHVESDTDLDTVVILDSARIRNGEYKGLREKTIFIDEFDRWATDELVDFVRNQYNCFFLIGRDRVCEVGSLMSINLLGYDGTTYRLINMYRDKKSLTHYINFKSSNKREYIWKISNRFLKKCILGKALINSSINHVCVKVQLYLLRMK